jgi:hypothetical protein
MGNFRRWSKDVILAQGETLIIQDPPVSEPIQNFSVHLGPSLSGPAIPGSGGSIAWTVFQGAIQKATGTLAAGATLLPSKLYADATMIDGDRVLQGHDLVPDPSVARTLHLVNNLTGDAAACLFSGKVTFLSENVIANN